jgi:hypothetical protein
MLKSQSIFNENTAEITKLPEEDKLQLRHLVAWRLVTKKFTYCPSDLTNHCVGHSEKPQG